MPARSWVGAALGGLAILSIVAAAPAVAAEKKAKADAAKPATKAAAKAKPKTAAKVKAKAPAHAAVPQDPRGRAIHACKEHVDRVMRSPNGTQHGPDDKLRVDDKGGEAFTVAGTVSGLREGTQLNHVEWECDVSKVGSGLMHTKTKLFLPR